MNECVRMDVCMFHVSPSAQVLRNVKLLPPTIVTKLKSKCSQNCSCWWKWFYACIHACLSSACCKRVITRFCRWFLQHIVCNSLSMFSFFLFEKTFFSIYYLVGGQRIAEKKQFDFILQNVCRRHCIQAIYIHIHATKIFVRSNKKHFRGAGVVLVSASYTQGSNQRTKYLLTNIYTCTQSVLRCNCVFLSYV